MNIRVTEFKVILSPSWTYVLFTRLKGQFRPQTSKLLLFLTIYIFRHAIHVCTRLILVRAYIFQQFTIAWKKSMIFEIVCLFLMMFWTNEEGKILFLFFFPLSVLAVCCKASRWGVKFRLQFKTRHCQKGERKR